MFSYSMYTISLKHTNSHVDVLLSLDEQPRSIQYRLSADCTR